MANIHPFDGGYADIENMRTWRWANDPEEEYLFET
jgi:hypothetical protein